MSPDASEPEDTIATSDELQRRAIFEALDSVLHALTLEPVDDDRFRAPAEPGLFGHIYGGQLMAQALVAATTSVSGQDPQSIHAYFVESGKPGGTLDVLVDRVRDGRSVSTRRVTVLQRDRPLLVAIASFHTNTDSPQMGDPPPAVARPHEVPSIEDWVRRLPPRQSELARSLLAEPLAFEQRMSEPPNYLGGGYGGGSRSHWMRLPREIGDDPLLQYAMLVYASDHLLLDMAYRAHPARPTPMEYSGVSLDHTIWFHRPVQFERWHLYTQETVAIAGQRGLTRGVIHDEDGALVASVMQEVLLRP